MNLYKVIFKSKDGTLAPLEIYTTAKTSEKAIEKVINKLWQGETKHKEIFLNFAIFPDDYIKDLTTEAGRKQFDEKRPTAEYISNSIL